MTAVASFDDGDDEVFDAEIVQLPERPMRPVPDRAEPVPLPWRASDTERRPVVARWVKDAGERRAALMWFLRYAWHLCGFHTLRLPLYATRAVMRVPVGVVRVMQWVSRWVNDADTARLMRQAGASKGSAEYRALAKVRADHTRPRRRALLAGVVGVVVAVAVLTWIGPVWLRVGALVAVVGLLAQAGTSLDRPLFDPAVLTGHVRRLSPGIVLRAFIAAKLCTEADPISFATPIHRDANGWRVDLDLPYGGTADQALGKRAPIASGLDVDDRQVFISRVRGAAGSARRLSLWVCEVDPLSVPAGRTPLLDAPRVDFWSGFPFGLDERGSEVPLCLVWSAMLVGAIPRQGKTFAARLVALAAALDPHVQVHVHDLKGGPDWMPLAQVAHRFFLGDRTDPDTGVDPVLALLDNMRELLAEVDRRNRTLRSLPASVCPEGKLTPELSRARSANMPLILVVIDEVQRAFGHKVYGAELDEALTDLAKVGPSAGIMLLAATQKPDSKSTPTGFRDQFGVKFALRVTTRDASEAVLGAGAYGEGLDASKLSPEGKGCGLLRGTGDAGSVEGSALVRTFFADGTDAEMICRRGRALREASGTLTGMAAGVVATATGPAYSVAADALTVLGSDEKAHSDVLCSRLAEQWPERYAQWRPAQLSAGLKPFDIRTRQVWATGLDGQSANRYGVLRAELLTALDER